MTIKNQRPIIEVEVVVHTPDGESGLRASINDRNRAGHPPQAKEAVNLLS
jgi:hypothetical protein